ATFARNDIPFIDATGVDHDKLGVVLKKAIYNYMHGIGVEDDVRNWFDFKVPKPTVPRNKIAKALAVKH
ncbi:MAG: radical SAM protein, partial [Comamonas sp.]|nr:radical SAM protein [Comamonas sp.]